MNIKSNKGFSLIEVLVTVGLVGILVGIAVPSYNGYKRNTVSMALKADLGSGAKVYNAKYAVESTFCFPFSAVGLPETRDGNPIYQKGGYYGFDSVGADCGGVDEEDVHWEKSDKECYDSSAKTWAAPTGSPPSCAGSATLKTKQGLAYEGGAPGACVLDSNTFLLGATTNTSDLKEFYYADQEGKIVQSASSHGSFDCTP